MIIPERPASAVQWARVFIHPALKNGSLAIDATAGNGLDTVFLAENVGPDGKVYAFDIQEIALENTKKALSAAGLEKRAELILGGHQQMDRLVEGQADAIMFNLGYLPGSNRSVLTTADTTREGVQAALNILAPGGRLSIVAYTGHPGAPEESVAVGDLLANLNEKQFSVQRVTFWNSKKESPVIFFVTRAGDKI